MVSQSSHLAGFAGATREAFLHFPGDLIGDGGPNSAFGARGAVGSLGLVDLHPSLTGGMRHALGAAGSEVDCQKAPLKVVFTGVSRNSFADLWSLT